MTVTQFDNLIDDILDEKHDRSLIILCSSVIDDQLLRILSAVLLDPVKKNEEDLLLGDNPLSTFSARIKMTYRLGLIDLEFLKILDTVRKVRNYCAHSIELNIYKAPLKDLIANLRKAIINRESYKLTYKRYFISQSKTGDELKCLFITICVILEAIISSLSKLSSNIKTVSISKR